jgi:hypothetical protein
MRKKSNRLIGVARLAMPFGKDYMSDYGVMTSRKDILSANGWLARCFWLIWKRLIEV